MLSYRILICLFLGLSPGSWAQSPAPQLPPPPEEQTLQPPPFGIGPGGSCGLVTKFSGHKIGDGCLQDAFNVTFDADVGVQRREGYGQFNTTAMTGAAPVRRLYPFNAPDGTEYVMAVSSDKVYSAGTTGAFTAVTGFTGLSQTQNTACRQGLGRFWCVNQSNGLFFWNGSSTGTVASGPLGNLLDIFRNRVLVANVSGNQSRLYGSGHLDGESWTTAAASTSPFIISIGGTNDGDAISCLMGTYNDSYLIGTEGRLYALYGFDNNDFAVREISREVGCIDNTSVQEMDGSIYWLSRRGIERMRGTELDWKVSYPIINLVSPIVESAGDNRLSLDTSQTDFEAGNLTASGLLSPMSSTISPGSVVPSSWSAVDTSSADFALGTITNAVLTDFIGSITLASTTFKDDFSDGNFTANPVWVAPASWTVTGGVISNSIGAGAIYTSSTLSTGSFRFSVAAFPTSGNQTNVKFFSNGTTLASPGYSLTIEHGTSDNNIRLERYPGPTTIASISNVPVNGIDGLNSYEVIRSTLGVFQISSSTGVILTATDNTYNTATHVLVNCTSGNCQADNFDFYGYALTATSSKTFDTGFSTPTFGNFEASVSSGNQTYVTFQIQSSTANNGGGFEALVSQSLGTNIGAAARRYVRYVATLTTDITTSTPRIDSISLAARTTGYFIGACDNPGSEITAWGLLQCNTATNGGSFSFEISTAATCHSATRSTATWNSQTNNSVITSPTAAFVAYRVLFGLGSDGDNQPALQDCTINWEVGARRPEVASGVHDHRYHLFYTTSTAGTPVNTNVLVLDQFDRWSQWDDIPARSATSYRTDLLVGDGASTGKVYRLYTGNDDNGSSFTSRIRTKDFDLGNWRANKSFGNLWLELSPEEDSDDNVLMSVGAYIDVSDRYALGTVNLDEKTGVVPAQIPWPLNTQNSGKYISLEMINTGTQHWRLYRGALNYYPLREE